MAKIATLEQHCPYCNKVAKEKKRNIVGKKVYIILECCHTIIRDNVETKVEEFVSRSGKSPYPYQIKSAEFFEKAGLNGICAHEMGVGKTVILNLLLRRNKGDTLPALIVVKAGLRYQMWLDIIDWTGMVPQIIDSGTDKPHFEYFDIFIISYDSLRLVRPDIDREQEMLANAGFIGGEEIQGKNGKLKAKKVIWTDDICSKFKFICLDECQMIKNEDASRTRAIKKIASGWQRIPNATQPRIMGLSGTPIKNDAGEYATILHLVNPTLFPSETGFIAHDCVPLGSGNRYRLRRPDVFHEKTKDFILRYTRAEVLPELPSISRMFRHAELEGGDLEAYKRVVKEFQEFMEKIEEVGMKDITNILGFFARMRRITGVAKVTAALEFIEEFLLSTDRKIVIFVHHKLTGSSLYSALSKLCQEGAMDEPLLLVSSLSMGQRQDVINAFKGVTQTTERDANGVLSIKETPTGKNHRVMIASTLAAGEGLNLQFCSDCLIMERQWNPANEEQAEARFPRPGQKADKINATYLIAAGSIDDFLTELVERKRSIIHSTLDNQETAWDQSSLIKDLAETIFRKGLKKWESPRI